MSLDKLHSLYTELRRCLNTKVLNIIDREEDTVDYYKKCQPQMGDIYQFANAEVLKYKNIDNKLDHDLDAQLDKDILKLNHWGWSEKRIKNFSRNFTKDDLRYDIWTNRAWAEQDMETLHINLEKVPLNRVWAEKRATVEWDRDRRLIPPYLMEKFKNPLDNFLHFHLDPNYTKKLGNL